MRDAITRDMAGVVMDPLALVATHARAQHVLRTVLTTFDREGVKALVVKGAVTSKMLYERPWERPMSDIDLRVEPSLLARVEAIAQKQGWVQPDRSKIYNTAWLRVDGLAVDVESTVGAPYMSSLSVRAMGERAERTDEWLGYAHWQAAFEDHVLLTCLNVWKDHLVHALPWSWRDLQLFSRHSRFDPERFARVAWRAGNASVVAAIAEMLTQSGPSAEADGWRRVRHSLGQVPRPWLLQWARWLQNKPENALLLGRRLLARTASDVWSKQGHAVLRMAWWGLARRFDPAQDRGDLSWKFPITSSVRSSPLSLE
ncbi:MAG: nucleotidyltransferase family protein [Deltaproteobacteria bacterium]|nr:nucleotidyltransferase family protein [Deltaproteobacteria bacterium]